jgi:4-amino-4-deoxy-L-arabinose transferase-like glycosyltransferase
MDRLARLRLAIFAGSLAVSLFMVFVVWHSQTVVGQLVDLYKFADIGRNIANGDGFRFTGGPPTMRRGPGYPGLIAALYFLFGEKPVVIQVCQCAFAAGTCVLVFEVGRRLFSERTGLLAAAIVGLHPVTLRYVPDIQVETFLTFLYTLTVYRTVRLTEEGTVWNGVWVGVAAACAAMVKAVALPYAALFAVCYLIWRWRSAKGKVGPLPGWQPVAAMIVAMGVVILPWTYRNYTVTGRFALISGNASGEFLRGYVFAQPRYYLLRDQPYQVGENEANEMQRDLFRSQGLVWERDEGETERVQNLAAKQKLRSDPGAFVKKFVIGLFMFWYVVTTRLNSMVVGGFALLGWILAAVGWIRGTPQRPRFWLLLLPIAALNLIYAAVLALGRYSAPCIPTLMVLAAFGIDRLLALLRARSSASKSDTAPEVAAAAPSP